MKKIFKTRICIILAVLIFAAAFSFLPAYDTEAATSSVLFVGNSLTYYNNMPEMFGYMAQAGGKSVNINSATYQGRTLAEHANAIEAVIKTKGQASRLTRTQKQYFLSTDTYTYSSVIYNNYAKLFWDYNKNRPRHYDTVVLQIYYKNGYGDATASSIYNSLARIINARNDSSTNYVINVTSGTYQGSAYTLSKIQKYIDYCAETAVSYVKSSRTLRWKIKNLWIAYTGRAICNYLFYTGYYEAIGREPGAFEILNYYWNKNGYINDMFCADYLHYTILGSYLEAAVIYSTIYGYANRTANYYSGGAIKIPYTLYEARGPQYGLYYNDGWGFADPTIPLQITYIAEATEYCGMHLTNATNTASWKNNKKNWQCDYMNHKAVVTFNGNGADINTFGTQTFYYYGIDDHYFAGTIEREGYKMLGWALSRSATTARYKVNNNVTNSWIENIYSNYNGAITLFAVWEKTEEEPVTEQETTSAQEPVTEQETTSAQEPATEQETSVNYEEPTTVNGEPENIEPSTQEPETQAPVVQEPTTQEPVTEAPVVQEPVTEAPVVQEPVTQEPVTEVPVIQEPEADTGSAEPEI